MTGTRGKYTRHTPPPAVVTIGGYEGLAAAVVWIAIEAARAGDARASSWLHSDGLDWITLLAPADVEADALRARLPAVAPAAPDSDWDDWDHDDADDQRALNKNAVTVTGVGARVRELRTRAGLSQGELAERAGIHKSAISHIETSRQRIGPVTAGRLAEALDVPVSEFLS